MAASKTRLQKRKTTTTPILQSPNPSPAAPQKAKQRYYPCSCTQRCKGRLKQVTRATYLKHAQFREIDAQQEARVIETTQINDSEVNGVPPLENGNFSHPESSGKNNVNNLTRVFLTPELYSR